MLLVLPAFLHSAILFTKISRVLGLLGPSPRYTSVKCYLVSTQLLYFFCYSKESDNSDIEVDVEGNNDEEQEAKGKPKTSEIR